MLSPCSSPQPGHHRTAKGDPAEAVGRKQHESLVLLNKLANLTVSNALQEQEKSTADQKCKNAANVAKKSPLITDGSFLNVAII